MAEHGRLSDSGVTNNLGFIAPRHRCLASGEVQWLRAEVPSFGVLRTQLPSFGANKGKVKKSKEK